MRLSYTLENEIANGIARKTGAGLRQAGQGAKCVRLVWSGAAIGAAPGKEKTPGEGALAGELENSLEQQVLSEAMQIHRNEARNAHLRALADSINDTARMARATLTLALVVALYLGVTLLSSTDLNLFLNGQVVLPQVGTGVSVVQSYIFAPPVFVYLHVQALFMLGVLARTVQAYDRALEDEGITRDRQDEYWDWLSAFAFVQLFRLQHAIWHPSRLLSWLGTNVVPLGLLFAVSMSFVRYQSESITWFHHGLFIADLIFVAGFN